MTTRKCQTSKRDDRLEKSVLSESRVSNDKGQSKRRAKDRFTPAQVIAALQAGGGIRLAAARMLRCSPSTIANYIDRYPDIAEACREIEHEHLDIAETVVLKNMARDDNPRLQLKAAIFYLKNRGKDLGYGGGKPRAREACCIFDFSRLSNDELTTLQELLKKAEIPGAKRSQQVSK
jgi:hypothetical protein